ncbi:MAG: response regulator [Lachnospiraceae bacterium]|nr:response regulator [Lachnospiraceae bacterium]
MMNYNEMISSLTVDYDMVGCVDRKTDEFKVIKLNDYLGKILDPEGLGISDKDKFFVFVNEILHPKDKLKFFQEVRKDNLAEMLRHKTTHCIFVRLLIEGKTMRYMIKLSRDFSDENKMIVALVCLENEDIAKRDLEIKEERNLEISTILASEYSSIYYIDLEEDKLFPYTMNEETKYELGSMLNDELKFSEAYRVYVDKFIYSLDKENMLKVGTIENIKEQLKDKKTFVTTYRSSDELMPRFCEMKFIKVDDDGMPATAAVLGFADKDEDISTKYIGYRIASNYKLVFLADLENDTQKIFYNSDGIIFYDGICLSKHLEILAERVKPEYQRVMKNLANLRKVREFLKDEDRREVIYEVTYSPEKPWRRLIWQVMDRKDGIAKLALVSIQILDRMTSSKLEIDRTLAEQKAKLEEQKIQLASALRRAEAANVSKTMFLSNMSHDIRTPMNAIIGFTNLALENIDDPEKVKKYLKNTSSSSAHLLRLINDILDMSRIESGKLKIEEAENDLVDIGNELMTIISTMAKEKNINVVFMPAKATNRYVYCDKLRFEQIFLNLLSNSIKFTAPGGNITVSLEQISGDEKKGTYCIKVKDDGIGMSKEFQKKLFEPFERERTSTISKTQGTGLGMAITKNIVDLMGGSISVESEPNKGTEFTVNLTLRFWNKDENAGEKTNELTLEEKAETLKNKNILIVEDNEMNREIMLEMFKLRGFKTDVAFDGHQAISKILSAEPGTYDIVLMDVQMPVMDGYEATRQIRKFSDKKRANVPIIAMTANAFEEDKKAAYDAGMNEHVAKPIIADKLIDTMYHVLYEK